MVCEPRKRGEKGGGRVDCVQKRREGFVFTKAVATMRNKQKDKYDEGCTEEEEGVGRSPAW